MKPSLPVLPAALVTTLLGVTASWAQAPTPGDEYRISTSMAMKGMALPSSTETVCVPRDRKPEEGPIDRDPGCQVAEIRTTGNTTRFRMICTGENKGEMTGETTTRPDGYDTRMTMNTEGREMTITSQGRKTGKSCDASAMERKLAAMEAEGRKQQAQVAEQVCNDTAKAVGSSALFFGPDGLCAAPKYRQAFCQNARTARGYEALYGPNARNLQNDPALLPAIEAGCGVKAAALKDELCRNGERDRTWGFLVRNCPAQAEPLAARECAGRDFTALQGSPYQGFCAAFASGGDGEGDGSGDAGPGAPPADAAADKPESVQDKAKRGFKSLRDRVGF